MDRDLKRDIKIAILSISCGILQIVGLVCLVLVVVLDNPALKPFLVAIFALSGFAAIVRWAINEKEQTITTLAAIAGAGILVIALVDLFPK